jgi:hypothetical protein
MLIVEVDVPMLLPPDITNESALVALTLTSPPAPRPEVELVMLELSVSITFPAVISTSPARPPPRVAVVMPANVCIWRSEVRAMSIPGVAPFELP